MDPRSRLTIHITDRLLFNIGTWITNVWHHLKLSLSVPTSTFHLMKVSFLLLFKHVFVNTMLCTNVFEY